MLRHVAPVTGVHWLEGETPTLSKHGAFGSKSESVSCKLHSNVTFLLRRAVMSASKNVLGAAVPLGCAFFVPMCAETSTCCNQSRKGAASSYCGTFLVVLHDCLPASVLRTAQADRTALRCLRASPPRWGRADDACHRANFDRGCQP